MAIYIKHLKKPKRCWECPCFYTIRDDGYPPGRDGCAMLGIQFNEYVSYGENIHNPFDEVYVDCPLIEVPEYYVEDIRNDV